MRALFEKIRRWFVGPSREEMGLPPEEALPPLHISPPVPYKPGTTEARWKD